MITTKTNCSETEIRNRIIKECADIAILYIYTVGKFYTFDGRLIKIGIPGFTDLFGFRISDKKMVFIETKTDLGKLRNEQKKFIHAMKNNGCLVGVARNTEQARKIIQEGETSWKIKLN